MNQTLSDISRKLAYWNTYTEYNNGCEKVHFLLFDLVNGCARLVCVDRPTVNSGRDKCSIVLLQVDAILHLQLWTS